MIASVTVLGGRGRSAAAVAAGVVAYLEGRQIERGGSRGREVSRLASPDGGVAAYYADSAGEGPGAWVGRGTGRLGLSGEVAGSDLYWVLQGKDPRTHESLLGARGSAGRSGGPSGQLDGRESWSLREASEVVGVSPGYLRRLAQQTEIAAAERVFALMAGESLPDPPATWLVAEKHGPSWRVTGDELRAYMQVRQPPTVVVGYDVTFSVEKSISAVWARADDRVRAEILAAVTASVDAGVDYLERQALRVRVKGVRHEGGGFVAASYLHSTSRAFDPQLHRHVVVANVATGPDGETRALDSPSLFFHAKTAGYLAGAELRHQLTARLGVEWTTVDRGLSEIAGVPKEAMAAISTRSKEMAAAAQELQGPLGGPLATTSPATRQALALATRAPKDGGVDPEVLRAEWVATLEWAGLDYETFASVLHRVDGPQLVSGQEVTNLFAYLAGAHGVTEHQAFFDRRHVVQAVAAWSVDRLSGAACEDLADRWLASPEVVPLHPSGRHGRVGNAIHREDGTVVQAAAEPKYSTRGMLAIESRIEDNYHRGRHLNRAVVRAATVDEVLSRSGFNHLSSEQQHLVRHMVSTGHETGLVRGPAGTGKTTAIEAAARAWEAEGYRVLGVSVNGNAAEILGRAAGIESSTVASLLWRIGSGGSAVLNHRTVLVLDEATTLATRDLDQLLHAVHEHEAALRLVGDPSQHSAVGAGGAFRWLLDTNPGDVAELTVNRRQVGEHMGEVRLALAEYREGAIAAAMERLEADQRVVTAESAGVLFDALAADWYADRRRAATDFAFESASMTAAHHDERRALVDRARALLKADGTLHGPEMVVGGMTFCAGDEVIAKVPDRNLRPEGADRNSHLKNGTRGTVVGVGEDHLVVNFEQRGTVRVTRSYIEGGAHPGRPAGLLHSYCLTTYAAQGDTYGASRHLGSDHSTRAELYVGLTRGRHDACLYAVRRHDVAAHIVDDDLPILRDDTNAARAMAASAAAGGQERLARELDPTAIGATVLADQYGLSELMKLVSRSDESTRPLVRRAYQVATDRIAANSVLTPTEAVVRMLGPRPPAPSMHIEPLSHDQSLRTRWDEAVQVIALYNALHHPRPFPSDNPTDELIGLRAVSPDPQCWDRVEASVARYVYIAPELEIALTQDYELHHPIESSPD